MPALEHIPANLEQIGVANMRRRTSLQYET
jgi:hypothetical protein